MSKTGTWLTFEKIGEVGKIKIMAQEGKIITEYMQEEIDKLKEVNAELLEALRNIAAWASDEGPLSGKSPMDIAQIARAAIAKAEKQ